MQNDSRSKIGRNDKRLKPYARLWMKALAVMGSKSTPAAPPELNEAFGMLADYVSRRRWMLGGLCVSTLFLLLTGLVTLFVDDSSNIKHQMFIQWTQFGLVSISVIALVVTGVNAIGMLQNKPDRIRKIAVERFFGDSLLLIALTEFGAQNVRIKRVDRIEDFELYLWDSLNDLIDRKIAEGGMLELSLPSVRDAQIEIAQCVLRAQQQEKSFASKEIARQWKDFLSMIRYSCARSGINCGELDKVFEEAKALLEVEAGVATN